MPKFTDAEGAGSTLRSRRRQLAFAGIYDGPDETLFNTATSAKGHSLQIVAR